MSSPIQEQALSHTMRVFSTVAVGPNPNSKPPIKQFIPSPNHSARNGAKIETIVLHCTEGNLQGAIEKFTNPDGRQVSAHYVIDVNGDIYQMVQDSERANHARGANQNSIGIEHIGQPDDAITYRQAAASAALIRWLLAEYEIPRTQIYGCDADIIGLQSLPMSLLKSA